MVPIPPLSLSPPAGARVMITGGANGIGRAVAEAYAAHGDRICILDPTEVRDAPSEWICMRGSAASAEDNEKSFAEMDRRWGGVDVAHANAGMKLWSTWSSHKELIARADHYLGRVALAARRDAPVAALSHGDKRKLEVAIMLALEPQVMMFDEPTAGMSVDEVPVVLDLIHQVKAERNKAVLLVEHKMDVVRSLSDRIVVLHNGKLVADGEPAEVIASPIVQQAYLGMGSGDE